MSELKVINALLSVLNDIEARTDELKTEMDGKPLSLGKAYLQGKLDGYAYVMLTLREALEKEEAKENG